MRTYPYRRALLFLLATAALSTGCAIPDDISAPQLHASVGPPSRSASLDGSVITLIDHADGTQFTLDVNAQTIQFSDGRVLLLDFDQTTDALATFHGTIVSDSVLVELGSFSAGCADPTQLECGSSPSTTTSFEPAISFVWRFVNDAGDGPKKGLEKGQKKGKKKYGEDGFEALSYSDPCSDIASAAINASDAFTTQRTSLWGKAWGYAVAEGVNWFVRLFPRGSASALYFGSDIADHFYARTNMSVLAFMWNSNRCSSRQVTAGPIMRSSSGGGGGRVLVCTTQVVEISFDGGNTWHRVDVTVCEYRSS